MKKDEIRIAFVSFLVDIDIRNENGLKSLSQLQNEYPEEWANFSECELGVHAKGTCINCGVPLPKRSTATMCVECEYVLEN
jgi:hypothetical protein